ncbi:hypothetical protein KDK95_30210 [Actinospica sp. MGRD01-02]|uniref:Uncharacterized protein n=1 Tax=Actinospica acidithermotolerans TaxID=2828514 RepID=A0A941EN56_9ACTN|nr:DUF6283 family protein [Actinospica acidithermotolerans]MBR7830614.1 hypothetical protein [Actinospica acidithermotolerans]
MTRGTEPDPASPDGGPPLDYRRRPCTECPWRRDADLGKFTDSDFAKLEATNGIPGTEAPPSAAAMSCHLDQPDTAHPLRLCAGWLAVIGYHHLAIRLHVIANRLPPAALTADADWPALYDDLAEMKRHRPNRSQDLSTMRSSASQA